MKLIIDIADSEAAGFRVMIKEYSYIKAKTLPEPDAEILNEIKAIKRHLRAQSK